MGVLPTFVFPLLAYTWEISLGSEQKKKIELQASAPHLSELFSTPYEKEQSGADKSTTWRSSPEPGASTRAPSAASDFSNPSPSGLSSYS